MYIKLMYIDVHQIDPPSTAIRRMSSDVTILMYIDVHQIDVIG
jgi:hypothetical protein